MASHEFIVADAGGTGTQWRLVLGERISQFETAGFNAYTHKLDDLRASFIENIKGNVPLNIPTYFYGAGIDTYEQEQEVAVMLKTIFGANVQVSNDLVGVARALCGKEEGFVGILGTGANACYYNGTDVNKVGASLGYVLGDEGSGAHLGKKLLRGVFRQQLSSELIDAFMKQFDLTSHQAIKRIYDEPKPNHFLASFAPFIFEHRHSPGMHELLRDNFHEYFDAFFKNELSEKKTFHFSGSIAYHFADILRQVGTDLGITIKNIVQSPISGLVLYHQQYD